jgi:hypothetical protein
MMADAELSPEAIEASRKRRLPAALDKAIQGRNELVMILGADGAQELWSDISQLDIGTPRKSGRGKVDPAGDAVLAMDYATTRRGQRKVKFNKAEAARARRLIRQWAWDGGLVLPIDFVLPEDFKMPEDDDGRRACAEKVMARLALVCAINGATPEQWKSTVQQGTEAGRQIWALHEKARKILDRALLERRQKVPQ